MKISQIIFCLIAVSYILFLVKKRYAIRRIPVLRLNYNLFLFFLTIAIANIFSLNSNILSSYDSNRTTGYYAYDWLDPEDIIKFPFQQLDVWNNNIKEVNIANRETLNTRSKINYTIILDQTGSVATSPKFNKVSMELRNEITNDITNPGFTKTPNNLMQQIPSDIDSLDLRELLVLRFIKSIYNSSIADSIYFQVLVYSGDDKCSPIFPNQKPCNKTGQSEVINTIINHFKKLKVEDDEQKKGSERQKKKDKSLNKVGPLTNFKVIFDKLSYRGYLQKEKDSDKSNAIIISDFEHEPLSGASFYELNNSIESLSAEIDIDRVTLLKLENAKPKEELSDQTIDLIQKNFKNSLAYYFDEKVLLSSISNYEAYLNSVFSSSEIDDRNSLYFFYPRNDRNLNTMSNSNVCFEQGYRHNAFVATLTNYNFKFTGSEDYMNFENNLKLFYNKARVISTGTRETSTLTINASALYRDDNFLEISSPDNILTIRYPIVFREKIPYSSSILLCICYLTVMYVLILNLFEYLRLSFISIKHRYNAFAFENKTAAQRSMYKDTAVFRKSAYYFCGFVQLIAIFSIGILFISCLIKFYDTNPKLTLLLFVFMVLYFLVYIKPGWHKKHFTLIKKLEKEEFETETLEIKK